LRSLLQRCLAPLLDGALRLHKRPRIRDLGGALRLRSFRPERLELPHQGVEVTRELHQVRRDLIRGQAHDWPPSDSAEASAVELGLAAFTTSATVSFDGGNSSSTATSCRLMLRKITRSCATSYPVHSSLGRPSFCSSRSTGTPKPANPTIALSILAGKGSPPPSASVLLHSSLASSTSHGGRIAKIISRTLRAPM